MSDAELSEDRLEVLVDALVVLRLNAVASNASMELEDRLLMVMLAISDRSSQALSKRG